VNPAPVQLFYVTLPEADGLTVLSTINGAAVTPMWTYFSIAVGVSGTYVYYDQWENGYDPDIANPANLYSIGNPGGTQIWGNGLAADGCPPNKAGVALSCTDANDVLNAGDVIVPFNSIPIPRNSNAILFDARDKVGASASIAMARATWASGSGTLNAFAHEMYATAEWGTLYKSPVGTNTTNAGAMFEYSGLSIMASQNNTTVQIDADANGSYETTVTLQEGGSTLAGSVRQGATVLADRPVQVVLVSGDIGSTYESRDMNLLPVSEYGSSYWSPVGKNTGGVAVPVRLFLYNPGASSIFITCKTPSATPDNYRDEFTSVAYNNTNGSINWSTNPWTEVNDNNSPTDGFIRITGGQLRFGTDTTTPVDTHIYRVAPMSGYTGATLSYSYSETAGSGTGDVVQVQVRNPPGTWATLATITGNSGTGTGSHDISAYIDSDTEIRFNVSAALEANELMFFDNVNIALSPGSGIATTTQSVGPNGVVTFDLNDNQAAHCFASTSDGTPTSDPIFAVGTMDTDGQAWDWSFTLFPDGFLSTDALVGLGLGQDPTLTFSQNGNPLWVTPACQQGTWVYVDWDNNGAADPVDTDGDGVAEAGSQNGIFVRYLQSVRLFDPAGGLYAQTGARVWSRTASGYPNRNDPNATPGCNLALTWGQDPARASAAAPGLDVGTSIPPLRLVEGTKSLVVANDTEPVGVLNPGDTVTYNITVKNAGSVVVNNVRVYDTVPANTSYFADTTRSSTDNINWTNIGQPDSGTLPLSAPGGVLLGNLNPGATFYVRFNVTLLVGDYEEITNCATVTTDAGEFVRCVTTGVATRDWGDLPDSYGTSAAQNGPRHSASGLRLGSDWDIEAQGNPTTDARGDDTTLTPDDEDGITQIAWTDYNSGKFGVNVAGASGCLNTWMDFTNDTGAGAGLVHIDGNFTKTGGYDTYTFAGITYSEHIIANVLLAAGSHELTFPVPPGLLGDPSNSYYFRFRLSPPVDDACTSGIAPTGFVSGGEIEDYRFTYAPTAITLAGFSAVQQGDAILVTWETASELDNRGFNLYRGTSPDGWDRRLNAALIPSQSQGNPGGFVYTWEDRADLVPGTTYFYWLEDVDVYNVATMHGPVSVDFIVPTAVTLGGMAASPAAGAAALPALWVAAAAGAALGLSRVRRR
jgi:uncharacterized repeat protein (TIGR01451 family)